MSECVLSGSAHPALAQDLARALGVELVPCRVSRFPDHELDVELRGGVRARAVLLAQPLSHPVGEHALELLLLADACRRAGAASLVAILPYVAYARQDRLTRDGQPVGARVLANILGTGSFSRVIAVDLHSAVIGSCIDAPVDHVTAVPAIAEALVPLLRDDSIVVAPDLGAVKLAESYSRALGLPLAVVSKVRISAAEVAVQAVVGDVGAKSPILVDDMISTGATIDAAVNALIAQGCGRPIVVAGTHGLFAADAVRRLDRPEVARVLVTDSLPPAASLPARLELVPLGGLLAEAVRRTEAGHGLDGLLASR